MWVQLIGQIAGAAAGQAAAAAGEAEAKRMIQASIDAFGKIHIPTLQKMVLEKVKDTELGQIKDDPQYKGEQAAADAQLNEVINSGGLTLADQATLNNLRAKLARDATARNEGLANDMAARGTLDSGAQLAMQMGNNQAATQQAALGGEAASAQAQARLFAAIQQRAQNAGQGLDRDWRQKSAVASAQDAINKGNADIANTATKWNANIPQQDFQNQMALTKAQTDPMGTMAGFVAGQAKDTKQQLQGLGNAAGQAGQGIWNQYSSGGNSGGAGSSGAGAGGGALAGANAGFGTNSNAITGESTRPPAAVPPVAGGTIIGYTADGKPVYAQQPQGQNF